MRECLSIGLSLGIVVTLANRNYPLEDQTQHQPLPMRMRKGIYLLPNLMTTGAMFGGFYAIVAAMQGMFEAAAVAIFIAMILDG